MNKKQTNKKGVKSNTVNSGLWEAISEQKQIDIKGGVSLEISKGIAQASAWPPKFPPFY